MYMFFGDSHSRQFVGTTWGIFCHYVFSGATIKGLANKNSITGHNRIIIDATSNKTPKTLFFMFGGVDLDFSYVKMCCAGNFEKYSFIKDRVEIYCEFIRSIDKDDCCVHDIYVLGSQISPFRGEHFYIQVPGHIGVSEDEVRRASSFYPMKDSDRASLVVEFNDALENKLRNEFNIKMFRIDRQMIEDNGEIKEKFIPSNIDDHHAKIDQTIKLWNEHIIKTLTTRIITG